MYAVMGITGQVGSAVAAALRARGKEVRAVVRNPEKAPPGVEVAVADYNDESALEKAFRGVDGVFVMIPPQFAPAPDYPESRATITAIRTALETEEPSKVVALSSIGAERDFGAGLITQLHILEDQFQLLPVPTAFLRAAWFMENAAWDLATARSQGKLYSFLQPLDRAIPMVATEDIGRIAAEVLTENWTGSRVIEVGGPRNYSPQILAEGFSRTLSRPVEPLIVPREHWKSTFIDAGMAADRTFSRIEMLEGLNSGWIDFGAPGTERRNGIVELDEVLQALAARI